MDTKKHYQKHNQKQHKKTDEYIAYLSQTYKTSPSEEPPTIEGRGDVTPSIELSTAITHHTSQRHDQDGALATTNKQKC